MKMELIDRVMQRMMDILDEKQLQELRMALVISLEGLTVEKEKTELSTEVIDNWEYVYCAQCVGEKSNSTSTFLT